MTATATVAVARNIQYLLGWIKKFPSSTFQSQDPALFKEKILLNALPEELVSEIRKTGDLEKMMVSATPQKQDPVVAVERFLTCTSIEEILLYRIIFFLNMHPSWQALIEQSMPLEYVQRMKNLVGLEASAILKQESAFTLFCLDALLKKSDLIPQELSVLTTHNDLYGLVFLSYQDFITIIDLVGVIDITEEIRQIVDKKSLQNILVILTERQKRYLQNVLHKPHKIERDPVNILNKLQHGVEKKMIRSQIHQRGLQRLAILLQQESPLLVWAIIHFLDVPRGQYLEQLLAKKREHSPRSESIKALFSHACRFLKHDRQFFTT